MRIDNEVLAVISRASVEGNKLFLTGQLDRNMYTKTNKVLEAAGGKWNKKAKAHVFDTSAADRIDQMIVTGSIEIPKDEFEFFPTPLNVATDVCLLASIREGMSILEPSAGRADLLQPIKEFNLDINCVEKMEANYRFLLTLPWIKGVVCCDFLDVPTNRLFDRIIMNPPFGRQADIKHVNHALRLLDPSGLLVAIMGAGVTFRDNKLTQDFRALVESRNGYINPLPEGSFKASGTMVNTCVVVIPGENY